MKDIRKYIDIGTSLVAKIVKNHPNDMDKTSGQGEVLVEKLFCSCFNPLIL